MSHKKSASKSAMPELVKRPDGRGALLTGGVPGNAGGGRPKNAVRQLARDKLPESVEILAKIQNGEAFLKDEEGNLIRPGYTHVISSIRELRELGLGPDAIPQAMIYAIIQMFKMLPEELCRPELVFTQDEFDKIGRLLDDLMGNAKVV